MAAMAAADNLTRIGRNAKIAFRNWNVPRTVRGTPPAVTWTPA